MKAAGEALNLKGHIAGFSKYQTNLCYGPGDIECHLGKVIYDLSLERLADLTFPIIGQQILRVGFCPYFSS